MARRGITKAFGAVVQRERKKRGLSQETLAAEAGIHRTHVGFIERGERSASLETAEKVATAFGMQLSALIRAVEKST